MRSNLALAAMLLAVPTATFAEGWFIETVDSSEDVGLYTSLALDSQYRPHIAYHDEGNSDLKYARWTGSSWDIETVDSDGNKGEYASLALDSQDRPHIAYHFEYYEYIFTYHDLRYARWTGSSWDIQTVDDPYYLSFGEWASLALDDQDRAHISCYEGGSNRDLKYCRWTGSAWDIVTVDGGAPYVGRFTSIALDSQGNPHISYYDYSSNNLKYARWDGSSWQIESLDTYLNVGRYTSIAIDGDDYPHISYYYYSGADVKYARWDGSTWQIESVDTTGYVGEDTSIALDGDDYPHISYYDNTNDDLKYARWDGSSWQIESVDTIEYVGEDTSIALDGDDHPHISYYDTTHGDLKYAYYSTAPSDFDLLSPEHDSYVSDTPTLDWEDAEDPQAVTYDLWYSTEPDFDPHEEVNDLTESTYTFDPGILIEGETYHWKVRAWDGYEETWCTAPGGGGYDEYWTFHVVSYEDILVTSFAAESAADGIEVSWECTDEVSGFNLYRSTVAEGKAVNSRDKLNAELITGESPYSYLDASVSEGATYSYWLEAIDVAGASETFGPVECTWRGALPTVYALYQSRPNPSRGSARIAFDLPEDVEATLTVYDISGRKVTTVVNETLTTGEHEAEVSGLAPGVYVYRLNAGTFSAARKMVIVE